MVYSPFNDLVTGGPSTMTALADQYDDEFVVKVSGGEVPDLPAGFDIIDMAGDDSHDFYTLRRRNETA
jgi:hypothetical protein